MNILFLTTHINAGGITSYLLTLAKGLIREGHQVHVASCGGNKEADFLSARIELIKISIRTKSELSPKIYFSLPRIKKYIKENRIDVIHAHTRITQVMGCLLSKSTGISCVTTCHGYFKKRVSRRLFPCWGEKVIAISQAVYQHLLDDFKVPEENIVLIQSGIDLHRFQPVDAETKKRNKAFYGLENDPVIGLVGRLSDVKGQDILIKAFPQIKETVPDAKLLFIGKGKFYNELTTLANKLNLGDDVIFSEQIEDLTKSFSALDIFVAPSRQEGLGLAIMEAQAMGLAVVASRVGGIPSLIEDGKNGFLVEPENSEELAEIIITLLKHPNTAKDVGHNARETAMQRYSSAEMVKQTMEVYEKAKRNP